MVVLSVLTKSKRTIWKTVPVKMLAHVAMPRIVHGDLFSEIMKLEDRDVLLSTPEGNLFTYDEVAEIFGVETFEDIGSINNLLPGGQLKNFLVSILGLSLSPGISTVGIIGSKAGLMSGEWVDYFAYFAATRGVKRIDCWDINEVGAVFSVNGCAVHRIPQFYHSNGSGYDLIIDDGFWESTTLSTNWVSPHWIRKVLDDDVHEYIVPHFFHDTEARSISSFFTMKDRSYLPCGCGLCLFLSSCCSSYEETKVLRGLVQCIEPMYCCKFREWYDLPLLADISRRFHEGRSVCVTTPAEKRVVTAIEYVMPLVSDGVMVSKKFSPPISRVGSRSTFLRKLSRFPAQRERVMFQTYGAHDHEKFRFREGWDDSSGVYFNSEGRIPSLVGVQPSLSTAMAKEPISIGEGSLARVYLPEQIAFIRDVMNIANAESALLVFSHRPFSLPGYNQCIPSIVPSFYMYERVRRDVCPEKLFKVALGPFRDRRNGCGAVVKLGTSSRGFFLRGSPSVPMVDILNPCDSFVCIVPIIPDDSRGPSFVLPVPPIKDVVLDESLFSEDFSVNVDPGPQVDYFDEGVIEVEYYDHDVDDPPPGFVMPMVPFVSEDLDMDNELYFPDFSRTAPDDNDDSFALPGGDGVDVKAIRGFASSDRSFSAW